MAGVVDKSVFAKASSIKDALSKKEAKEVADLYKDWAGQIGELADYYDKKPVPSAAIQYQYYQQLKNQVTEWSKQVTSGVYDKVGKSMNIVADAVVADNAKWMSGLGFSDKAIDAAFSNIPQSTVNALLTGSVYGGTGSWSLSKAIWGDNQDTLKHVYQIVAQGVVMQMPTGDIARKLEQYVNPSKQFKWNGPEGYPPIYGKKVDYNAQRLVRTLTQHTYQQSVVATAKSNPLIEKIRWVSNGSRVCPLCMERDGKVFPITKVPLDHPNGMCVLEPVVNWDKLDELADWVNEPDGTYPWWDNKMQVFGYEVKPMTIQQFYDKYGTDRKSFASWYNTVGQEGREAFDKLYSLYGEGDTKNQFFKKYITSAYGGGGQQVSVAPKVERVTKEWLEQNLKIKGGARQFSQDELKAMARAIADDDVPDSYKKLMVDTMKKRGIKFDADRGAFYKPADKAVHVNRRSKGLEAKESNEYGTYRHLPGSSRFQARAKAELGSVGKDGSRFGTIFHEYGHAIDDLAPSMSTFSSQAARGFEKAMKEDMKAFEKRVADLRKAAASDYDSFRELFKIQQDLFSGAGHGFSDAVSAMHACPTGYDATKTLRTYYKHSEDYYRRGAGSPMLYDTQRKLNNAQTKACHKEGASELFANISASMSSSTERSIMQEYFPRSFEKFKEIIEDVAAKKKLV